MLAMSSREKKKLIFSHTNSRIHFGNIIYEAAKQGDWEGLELILAQEGAKEHIDYTDKHGHTPLVAAAKNAHLRCVKILLANGCNLHATVTNKLGKEMSVWEIAAARGFRNVALYLNGCLDDLTKYSCHRAMMEADVLDICQNKRVTQTDLNEFDKHLEILTKCSTFDIDGDGQSESLLITAIKADNSVIVKKLLKTYKTTPYANDPKTGESALHIACKNLSPLRFYITCHCTDLIFSVDTAGQQPLHIACKKNDISYVSWLFQSVLEKIEQFASPTPVSPVYTSLRPSDISLLKNEANKLQTQMSLPNMKGLNSLEPPTHPLSHRQLPLYEKDEEEGEEYSPVQKPIKVDLTTGSDANTASGSSLSSLSASVPMNQPESSEARVTVFSIDSSGSFEESMSQTDSLPEELSPEQSSAKKTLVTQQSLPDRVFSDTELTYSSTVSTVSNTERADVSSGYETLTTSDRSVNPVSKEKLPAIAAVAVTTGQEDGLQSPRPPLFTPTSPLSNHREGSFFSSSELSSFIDSTSSTLRETVSFHGPSPIDLKTLLGFHMRLFSISANGDSVLHIMAKEGHSELLHLIMQVAKYLEHNPDGADINVLVRREGSIHTPLDVAIERNHAQCLRILLEFARETSVFEAICNDGTLLQRAVAASSVDCLKLLCEWGQWKGTDTALMAALKKTRKDSSFDRYLMFYHTQVILATVCSRVKRNGFVTVDTGVVRWNEMDLEELKPVWLEDASVAIATVSHELKVEMVNHPIVQNRRVFERLGKACNEYFDGLMWQPELMRVSGSLPITEIDLSGNRLENIPSELFQISTLSTLNLSNNHLVALPSSLDFHHPLYTCSKLTKLDLSYNCLLTLPEDLFCTLGNVLEELNVKHNNLVSLPPALWVCTQLQSLNLSHNCLSQLHYFSDVKYYYDYQYSRGLINSMQMEHGIPLNSGKLTEEEFMNVMNYATRLNVFYQTINRLLPTVLEQSPTMDNSNLLQQVIDIHWLRTKLNSNQSNTLDYFDVSLPPDEAFSLTQLDLSYNSFTSFPQDLPCVAPHLEKLDMRGNRIERLDMIRDMPSDIASIILSENKIESVNSQCQAHACMNPVKLLAGYVLDPKQKHRCQHKSHCMLDKLTNLVLSNNRITSFPCVPQESSGLQYSGSNLQSLEKIEQQPFYPSLSVLTLDRNCLSCVPEGVHCLVQLSSLSLSHNPNIVYLPPEMGLMNPQVLLILKLEGVFPKNIDVKLLSKPGARGILTYLKSLYQKSYPYLRIKLMFIGNSNVGKTSLLQNLTKKGKVTRFKEVEKGLNKQPLSTVGVDLGDWDYSPSPLRPKVTFMTWDFGGQIEYYATHQCFLTQRSLYVIVWNAQEKEKGLDSIHSWIDNIGSRVPKAPVLVVATHLDGLPSQRRNDEVRRLQAIFHKKYLSSANSHDAYPDIRRKCIFVSCSDGTQISQLRDEIYEVALEIKPASTGVRKVTDGESLLKQPVPACYLKLQDIVRSAARRFIQDKTPPILNKKEFRKLASEGNFPGKLDELDQGTAFLHENGIMLHYDDPSLNDLYFIDPQWLCSMLACVVTVQEKNPFQKNGFMEYSALKLVLRDERFPHSFLDNFVSLMQKFEVALLLDNKRLLIPSLLPADENHACIVFPLTVSLSSEMLSFVDDLSNQTFARISSLEMQVFARYYLLPFIPNGFFPRLIARIIGSKITACFTECVPTSINQTNVYNGLHWRCWRDGIVLLYSHMEVLRISPTALPYPGTDKVYVSSSKGRQLLAETSMKGIEIMVAVLPENLVVGESEHLPCEDARSLNHHLGVWLLRQLTEITDSVFEDWYEGFARRKGFDFRAIQQASPCPLCLSVVFKSLNKKTPVRKSISAASGGGLARRARDLTSSYMDYSELQKYQNLHLFSSPYCVLTDSKGMAVTCRDHGHIPVRCVAPDLAFADFPSSMLFHKSGVKKLEPLGSGGFGSVYKAVIEGSQVTVAVKEFSSHAGKSEEDSGISQEMNTWDVYLNGSREARMMYQLQHTNILTLVGLAFQPLQLILELAPLGDLKNSLKPFKHDKVKLNRRTLQQLMYQVADAMEYIHSKHIIYRDLKPGNVLVWEFPEPKTQWNSNVSVYIKIADYGISKHCTPEGARGSEGTPAFLPPEVILYGGTAAFTTQLDVYSFGMFMYYLFTYTQPFENEKGRPISALLNEGKRPEMLPSQRPLAIQMYELMCWCWSDDPQHRPTFNQIKDIISSSSFTQLLDTKRLTAAGNHFTTACVHTFRQFPRRRNPEDALSEKKPTAASPSPSVLSALAASADEEDVMTVYYGTNTGEVGAVAFLPAETVKYEIVGQLQCQITSIVSVGGTVWIGTWGKGISIYHAVTKGILGQWGWKEGTTIYKLLYVRESSVMVVLTGGGVVILDSCFETGGEGVLAEPTMRRRHVFEQTLTTGVVVAPHGSLEETEVWCCPMRGGAFKVLSHFGARTYINDVFIPPSDIVLEPSIHQIVSYEREHENKLVVADGHFLQFWDVNKREKEKIDIDCHALCKDVHTESDKSIVTSLLVDNNKIYTGTQGGTILVIDFVTMETVHLFQGHSNEVVSILSMTRGSHHKRFSRFLSKKDSLSTSIASDNFSFTFSTAESPGSDRNLIVTLGHGQQSVVGNFTNHPSSFTLPVLNCCPTCSCGQVTCNSCNDSLKSRTPTPNPNEGYMLYWSSDDQLFSIAAKQRIPSNSCSTILEQSTEI